MNNLIIHCANNNQSERRYIINTLLLDFLGIDYKIEFTENSDYYEIFYGEKKIEFKDFFFSNHKEKLSYLSAKNIPQNIRFLQFEEIKSPLPIIYGNKDFEIDNDNIKCGLDIFASAFFMLTRWEEYVISQNNTLNKVDEFELWAVKNKVHNRAIVNEYVEFLRILLDKIGVPILYKNHCEVMLTHDVDWCYLSPFRTLLKNLKSMFFKKKLYKKSILIAFRYFYYKIRKTKPFNSFDELMDKSDEYGFKNHFYFKATADGENGHTYSVEDSKVKKIICNVIHRGHKIGLHPSENTIDNYEQFKEESKRLKRVANTEVNGGRNHGLYYNHNMYHYWEKEEYEYDSGLGFQFLNGFRSGTCYSYKIFDIYKRETLELREIPFIAMDSVAIRNKLKPHEFYNDVIKLIDIVKKYNGIICINGHSNMINMIEMKKYKKVYYDIVDYLGELDGIQ